MKTIHIANTNFEWECEQKEIPDLRASFELSPHFLQLQFLPLLYAQSDECIAITQIPYCDERFLLMSEKIEEPAHVVSFAPSRAIKSWADSKGFFYEIPDWNLIRELSSKELSFSLGLPPEGSRLLHDEKETSEWASSLSGLKVLKSCFGVSARGHRFVEQNLEPHHKRFLHNEWQKGLPVIGEPWVERILDFSSHWIIDETISCRGFVKGENDARGSYQKSLVGPPEILFPHHHHWIDQHCDFVLPLLSSFRARGFFGPIGFDAMIYRFAGKERLQPIVEINPRMTMGSIARKLAKSDQLVEMSYEKNISSSQGLLPNQLGDKIFTRNLFLTTKSINL